MNYFTYTDSPIGRLLLRSDGDALTGIYMDMPGGPPRAMSEWTEDAAAHPFPETIRQLEEYFKGERREFDLPLRAQGTEFQQRAWKSLTEIPYGQTRSYGEQAKCIGNAKASRAVGLANGSNPLPIVVPCHRVIGADGSLTGFGGGLERKRWLLSHEGVLDERQHHRKDRPGTGAGVGTVGRDRPAVVKLGDEPHDVKAQSEMRFVIPPLSMLE
jgi:methylated-DNA-[protein]-cysteine S-methyltransferase